MGETHAMSILKAGLFLGLVAAAAAPASAQQPPSPPATPPAPTAAQPPAAPAATTQGVAAPQAQPATPAATPSTAAPAAGQTPASAAGQAAAPAAPSPATEPASGAKPGDTVLPPVQVIQEKPKPPPKPKVADQPKPKAKKVAAPPPPPPASPPPAVAAAAPAAPAQPVSVSAPPAGSVEAGYVRMSPVGGSELPIAKVPTGVSTVTAKDIERSGSVSLQDTLQQRVPGVVISDAQGNGFQTDVQYRGFSASPVNGQAQGLAIYQNGVRINESFGDIVNWDFLPSNAINDITVVSGNPVFGLNAIGGAISLGMKDGFTYHGAEVDARAGSFGRRQVGVQAGGQSGAVGAFIAGEVIRDDGWRQFSPSRVNRLYADLGVKTSDVEAHINFTGASNFVGAVTAAPIELLGLGWNRVYTNPQTTKNEMAMVSFNGAVKATSSLTLSAVAYLRHFRQSHLDANIFEAEDCGDGTLCVEGEQVLGTGPGTNPGGTIPFAIADPLGSIDRTSQQARSWGTTVQAADKSRLFGLPNQFVLGASYDHGRVAYTASSELGVIGRDFVTTPLGIPLIAPDDISPRNLTTNNDYYGLFFSNTLDVTRQLSLTVGGRFNYAEIGLQDNTGNFPEIDARHSYQRFNPMAGATYKVVPGISLYGSYSEANRAPTAAELACADPANPCLIESFLTADPPLKQVVSHTWELGVRGEHSSITGKEKLNWNLGLFRTNNTDDIINAAAPISGRGFFQNAGSTLRQGIEASVDYRSDRWFLYAAYNYVDATFQSALELPSPNNPSAVVCAGADPLDPNSPTCVNVSKGDRLPGVPAHKLKAGFDYWLTPKWKFGADLIAVSDQVYFGDEANQNPRLPGYVRVDLHTSYDVTKNIQLYGLVQNLFDSRYGLFGNYFNLDSANAAGAPSGVAFTDPRTFTPAMPFAAYGGVKVKF